MRTIHAADVENPLLVLREEKAMTVYAIKLRGRYSLKWRDAAGCWRWQATGLTRRRDAERLADQKQYELDHPPRPILAWSDACERYSREIMAGKSPGYRAQFLSCVRRAGILSPVERVDQIDQAWLNGLQAALAATMAISSVASYLRVLRAFFRWLRELDQVGELRWRIPQIPDAEIAGGEPITAHQFARLLDAVPLVVETRRAQGFADFLRGLWLSGFRLSELFALSWDSPPVQIRGLSERHPLIVFTTQKSKKPELWPIPPDWVAHLRALPPAAGGPVYWPLQIDLSRYGRASSVGKVIGQIGQRAAVTVDSSAGRRFVSANDLRRSFAQRWTELSHGDPEIVRRLTRHADHRTTRRFYARESAAALAQRLETLL